MRRIFPSIVLTSVVLAMALPSSSLAVSNYETSQSSAFGVIGTASSGTTYSILDSFTFDENMGQDLYEVLYEKIAHEGSDLAVERTGAARNLSKEEIFTLIDGSNIRELLTKENPKQQLSEKDLRARREAVLEQLADDKELADLQVLATTEVDVTEIFSNGDESDSGFDLLVDLAVIDQLIFGKVESPVDDGGPGDGRGGEERELGPQGEDSGAALAQRAADLRRRGPPQIPDNRPESQQRRQALRAPAEPAPATPPEGQVICPTNDDFNSAAEAALSGDGNANNPGAADANGEGNNNGDGAGGLGTSEDALTVDEAGGFNEAGELVPAGGGNWARPITCPSTDIICVFIRGEIKTESSYTDFDNCIACHLEKINDALKKTLDRNLVPAKVTGNLFEGPKCKGGMFGASAASFNILMIPQPILTPPNDELVTSGSFIANMLEFYERYVDDPGRCDAQKDGGSCRPLPSPDDDAAGRALQQVSEGTSLTNILKEVRKEVAMKKAQAEQILENTQVARAAEDQASQFSVILAELDTMNNYFASFRDLYIQLGNPEDAESPCRRFIDKEVCS